MPGRASRHTGRLLTHIGARTPQTALHDFNESNAASSLIESLKQGTDIALVSDAGTPLVSDPGFRLVAMAHDAGIPVVPIPGASAVTAALSVAGLATDRFCFEGFLPAKAAARQRRLEALAAETRTLVFFESVHRITDTLEAMAAVFGRDRAATLARELTKVYESVTRSTLGELLAGLKGGNLVTRGEFVIVVGGADPGDESSGVDFDELLRALIDVLPGKQAAHIVARVTGESRNVVYRRMLQIQESE